MASNPRNHDSQHHALTVVDGDEGQSAVIELLEQLAARLWAIEQKIDGLCNGASSTEPSRDYYSIAEFAAIVEKSQYTVREWCRLQRINAEKCDTGRGDAKSWKVSHAELERYRNHGLLPATYLR